MVFGADYECLYAHIGTNRRNPDGLAWARCSLKGSLDDPTNPCYIPLPDRTIPVPFVLTGDEAFGLAKFNLTVKQTISNSGISRGRRISENSLGILCNRRRCLDVPFLLSPEKVKVITLAVLVLHNWLRADISSKHVCCPPVMMDQEDHDRQGYFRHMGR